MARSQIWIALVATATLQPVAFSPLLAQKMDTAERVATALADSGLPIVDIEVFTSKSDPNKLMGRPSQYTSKVNFEDTRYPLRDDTIRTTEPTIEGFATVADAKKRVDYVTRISSSSTLVLQYIYHSGKFVLRLPREVEPDDAKAYQTALSKVASQKP